MGASYLNNFTLETVSNYKILKYPIFEPTHILACFFVCGINHVKLPYIDEPDGQKPGFVRMRLYTYKYIYNIIYIYIFVFVICLIAQDYVAKKAAGATQTT